MDYGNIVLIFLNEQLVPMDSPKHEFPGVLVNSLWLLLARHALCGVSGCTLHKFASVDSYLFWYECLTPVQYIAKLNPFKFKVYCVFRYRHGDTM